MTTDKKTTTTEAILAPTKTLTATEATMLPEATKETTRRKRTSLRDSMGNKGPLWLPADILPGYRVRWPAVTANNPYKLYQLQEIGYGPLSDSQIELVLSRIPEGLVTQTRSERGSYITKQSGTTTHYLMCIKIEDALDIEAEKAQINKEKNDARLNNIKSDSTFTSVNMRVGSDIIKTWN